ncbi:diaminopimelate epimerase [Sphingomonas sp. Leaf33]|uniref:diaminopimelate epimerase n=1 Tax=Sphingomonas sp. Leaf33 TaxID=1736215 RepID=UPI0006FAB731|nr:diaminopimelate epimerase [Sphingomonas sp. Leaf33]KQN19372.1 diaminopimelate epimerase [Sphingomonas sp. Leaf33]
MRFAFTKCHGSGNDFPLIDARAIALRDAEWASVARALADRAGPVGGDGILLLTNGAGDADFGMRMFNSDGSEAETCLNGLRCTARAGFEALGLETARVRLKVSCADVAHVADIAPGVYGVETRAGPASTDPQAVGVRVAASAIDAVIPGLPSARAFTAVAMPNPHLVTFVERVDEAELVRLGEWCEARPDLLVDRANVSFVELRGTDLFVRTHERGVGLTDACGSAMAASTFAAGLTGRVPFGTWTTVFNPGGRVRARAEAPTDGGMVTIQGNATFEWDGEIKVDLASGMASGLVVTRRREHEVAAWARVVAG